MRSEHLIECLTASEKRYISIAINQFGANSKQKKLYFFLVNESKTILDLESKFGKNWNLIELKLYAFLLKTLRSYNETQSIQSNVLIHFQNIELFYTKGLLKLCRKEIEKVKKKIEKEELYFYSELLWEWEKKLDYYDEEEKIIDRINRIQKNKIKLEASLELNHEFLRYTSQQNDWSIFLMTGKLKRINEENVPPYKKQELYISQIYKSKQKQLKDLVNFDLSARLLHLQEEHDIFNQNKDLIKNHFFIYLDHFYNFILIKTRTYSFDEAKKLLTKFKQFEFIFAKEIHPYKNIFKDRLVFLNLHINNIKGDFDLNQISVNKTYFELNSERRDYRYLLCLIQQSYALFGTNNFRAAKKVLETLKELTINASNSSFFDPVLLLDFMLNYELKNDSLIERDIRRISKSESLSVFIKSMLHFFRILCLKTGIDSTEIITKELLRVKELKSNNKLVNDLLERIDYLSWLESKISSFNFQEQYRINLK